MAEHWSAAADVALLREQLGLIGGALASQVRTEAETEAESGAVREPVRKPIRVPARARVPVRERPYWRPLRTFALGVAGVTAAGAMVTGAGWLLSQAGNSADGSGGSTAATTSDSAASHSAAPDSGGEGGKDEAVAGPAALSRAGYLACARLVVEGTVTAVDPGQGADQERITLRVTRYYKPDKGPAEVTFVMDQEAGPRPAVGDHTLIGIPTEATSPDIWTTDEKEIAAERAGITAALPKSRTVPCD